jgi:hypothetical protein
MIASRPIGSGKSRHQHIGSAFPSGPDGYIHVGHKISGALGARWKRYWSPVSEYRDQPDRTLKHLRQSAAGSWSNVGDNLLCTLTAESTEKTRYKPVKILRRDIDMGRIVLGANGNVLRCRRYV